MSLTFNLLLIVVGAPVVVTGVGLVVRHYVYGTAPAVAAYIKSTEPETVPAGRSHANSIAA